MRRLPPSTRLLWFAATALCALVVGLVAGLELRGDRDGTAVDRRIELQPTPAFPAAAATLAVGRPDGAGNRPLRLAVRGLQPTTAGAYYELVLVADGRIAVSCGRFRLLESSRATISLNAPYRLRGFDGWWVIREDEDGDESRPVTVLTSS